MDNTAVDFWQMIWEQDVEVIGMLTALVVGYWYSAKDNIERKHVGDNVFCRVISA